MSETGVLRQTGLLRLKEIIEQRCIITSEQRWLVSPRGQPNQWLIDMRQAFMQAEALDLIAEHFWDRFADSLPFQLGGLEIAAIPMVVAFLLKARTRGLDVNGFVLRKERKTSGVGKTIEGTIGPEPIFVVDDIINSGGSLEKVRMNLAREGRSIDRVFVVVDFESANGIEWRTRHALSVASIFKTAEFGLSSCVTNSNALRSLKIVWSHRSPGANHFHLVPKSSPLFYQGKVIFGSDRGTLWALEARTGQLAWTFQISEEKRKGIWSSPAECDGVIFFGGYDGVLYALDSGTGSERWRYSGAEWIGSSPTVSEADSTLWIGLEHAWPDRRGSIAAFDVRSGEKRWEHWVADYVHGSPTFSPKYRAIAIGANDGCLYLFDAFSGELRWTFRSERPFKAAPIFDEEGGLVYVGGFDGHIRAIDVMLGEQVWAVRTIDIIYSAPVLAAGRLFVTSHDKNLHMIDLKRKTHKRIALGGKSTATPALIGDSIFFGANDGVLYEVDPGSQSVIGSTQLPDPLNTRVAYDPKDGLFFVTTFMNETFALERG